MKRMKKLIAVLMACVMVLSLTVVFSSAKGKKSADYTGKSLVVMGDSIAAGFGLTAGVEDTWMNCITMSHGGFVQGAWPQIVRDTKGFSQTTSINLSRNMWRTDEFLRLLDPTFAAELNEPENAFEQYMSDYMMMPNEFCLGLGDTTALASQIREAVEQADVLVLCTGSNDIMTASIAEPIMIPVYQAFGRQYALGISTITGQLGDLATPEEWMKLALGETNYTDLAGYVRINMQKYFQNYERLVNLILELNSDVELYTFGIDHPFQDMEIVPGIPDQLFMPLNDEVIATVRNYMLNKSEHKDRVTYVDMSDIRGYSFDYEAWPLFFYDFILDVHPMADDHIKIAQHLMDKM